MDKIHLSLLNADHLPPQPASVRTSSLGRITEDHKIESINPLRHYRSGAYRLTGRIIDAYSREKVQARVQVLGALGDQPAPTGAMWKIGTGQAFFYSDGEFSIIVPRGRVQVTVERGTEYTPWRRTIDFDEPGETVIDVELRRWCNPAAQGWHPGNLHLHYKEFEDDPDRRILYDSRVEDLRVTALSYVKRWDLKYASNKYAPGVLEDFTDARHYVECGEETRHYMGSDHVYGFGHVMLLNLRNVVEPAGRGLLVDDFAPEYPPISYACDDTHRQGGIVIWCHNGHGIECSVAAILGKVDALSLWDVYWEDLAYDAWYRLLDCGVKLPASTGSDWFLCSGNRVYTKTQPEFDPDSWFQALRDGKTFITNGPMLDLSAGEASIGDTVQVERGETVSVIVNWTSHYPIHKVEVISNGKTVHSKDFPQGSVKGSLECEVTAQGDGWVAARLGSDSRDSFDHAVWAHTSPVYVDTGGFSTAERRESAALIVQEIEDSISWLLADGKFITDQQRDEVVDLFRKGQDRYRRLTE